LDRALGQLPDPRQHFTPPTRFAAALELPAEVAETEALLFAARRLLAELTGFLVAAHGGVQGLNLTLSHADRLTTRISLDLITPSRDLTHLTQLLRERLDRLVLPAPVHSITLRARDIRPLPPSSLPLFPSGRPAAEDWPLLMERLRARLGSTAVHSITPLAEHRPERAWRTSDPGEQSDPPRRGLRPLWLLAEIRSLEIQAGNPCLNGPLRLLAGPERIESGWWDGQDIARDYFVAQTRGGSRVWVFRECRSPQTWYLHGIFA
jgi:protein ImuB